ncbi:hypothetical protein QEZ54_16085 [Catellatospora sp. KI3]|uniref:hypothetical protein n=1 Tax=Catellatospora sp. KI3 TaxID=3041620 RepID=UPI002482AE3E|nr:hypothetical protein [Catellatospora sp. KI3]MDI1462491.1 hypothetical protein [Catellatospora sp. KI3]
MTPESHHEPDPQTRARLLRLRQDLDWRIDDLGEGLAELEARHGDADEHVARLRRRTLWAVLTRPLGLRQARLARWQRESAATGQLAVEQHAERRRLVHARYELERSLLGDRAPGGGPAAPPADPADPRAQARVAGQAALAEAEVFAARTRRILRWSIAELGVLALSVLVLLVARQWYAAVLPAALLAGVLKYGGVDQVTAQAWLVRRRVDWFGRKLVDAGEPELALRVPLVDAAKPDTWMWWELGELLPVRRIKRACREANALAALLRVRVAAVEAVVP